MTVFQLEASTMRILPSLYLILICDIIHFSYGAFCTFWEKSKVFMCFPPSFLFPQEKEGVDAVSVGAILSDYQRVRVENV